MTLNVKETKLTQDSKLRTKNKEIKMKKSKKNILVFDHMKIGLVRKAYINDLN